MHSRCDIQHDACLQVRGQAQELQEARQVVQLTRLCGEDIPLIDAATVSAEPSPLPPKRGTAARMKRCSSSLSRHIHLPLMVTQTPAHLLIVTWLATL